MALSVLVILLASRKGGRVSSVLFPSTCPAWEAPSVVWTHADLALRVIEALKPQHHVKESAVCYI